MCVRDKASIALSVAASGDDVVSGGCTETTVTQIEWIEAAQGIPRGSVCLEVLYCSR